jgi:hypothetical protein
VRNPRRPPTISLLLAVFGGRLCRCTLKAVTPVPIREEDTLARVHIPVLSRTAVPLGKHQQLPQPQPIPFLPLSFLCQPRDIFRLPHSVQTQNSFQPENQHPIPHIPLVHRLCKLPRCESGFAPFAADIPVDRAPDHSYDHDNSEESEERPSRPPSDQVFET